jgi:hypothetical protein
MPRGLFFRPRAAAIESRSPVPVRMVRRQISNKGSKFEMEGGNTGAPMASGIPLIALTSAPKAHEHWAILGTPMGPRLVMPLTSRGEKHQGCDLNHTRG